MLLLLPIPLAVLVQQTHTILMLQTKTKLGQSRIVHFSLPPLNKTQYSVNNIDRR